MRSTEVVSIRLAVEDARRLREAANRFGGVKEFLLAALEKAEEERCQPTAPAPPPRAAAGPICPSLPAGPALTDRPWLNEPWARRLMGEELCIDPLALALEMLRSRPHRGLACRKRGGRAEPAAQLPLQKRSHLSRISTP